MESRLRKQWRGTAALGLAVGVGLLFIPLCNLPAAAPTREVGATAAVRSIAVTDVVLGVGADETERNLAWFGTDPEAGCVQYAEATGDPFRSGIASVTSVEANASGDAVPAGHFWFHATMTNLEPSARYAYRLGDCENAWSTPAEFSTQDERSSSLLFFGDPQLYAATDGSDPAAGWAATLQEATHRFPETDFLVTAGDHVDSTVNDEQTREWELFLEPPQLRQYAVAPTIGNHDEADGTGTQFGQHFALPNVAAAGETVEGSGDYWFTHNGALFMTLNSNSLDVAEHETFMEEALAANPGARWTIVSFHHAPFSAAAHGDDADVMTLRESLPPILSDLGIDLVLGGHDHSYARSFLMDGTEVVPDSGGTTVTAAEGQVLYITANSASGSKFYELGDEQPWTAVANQERVANYTHVLVDDEAVTITTYRTTDGSAVDSVTLVASEGRLAD